MIMKCKGCKYWKNKQRLLNYSDDNGFCINPAHTFNTTDGRLIGVVDIGNQKDRIKVSGNPSHDFESVKEMRTTSSRYLLQTNEEFGCILMEKLNKDNG